MGPTYPVVLTFQRAGSVTLQVPVANPSENQGPTGGVTTRTRTAYRCSACEHRTAQWVGRCPSCQTWGTLVETAAATPSRSRVAAGAPATPARRIADVALDTARARPTGVSELDRVLGGGLVPGAVVLLAGEPGVGKSTLLLEVAAKAATAGAVRHRRGVGGPGAAAGRAHRRAARRAVPRGRVRPRRHPRAPRGAAARPADRRLHPDDVHCGRRRRAGRGDADARRDRRAHRAGQGARAAGAAGRARHQGRRHRRAAGAGAPGRRRAVVRGRQALHAAHGAGREEPLRTRRRGGLLRAARRGDRRDARPVRVVLGPVRRTAGARARRSPSSWTGGARCPPRCRPWCTARTSPARGGR